MIHFSRTLSIAPGKNAPAMKFLHEVVAYLNATYHADLKISVPVGGNPNRLRASLAYKVLGEMQSRQEALAKDAPYAKMTADGSDTFIGGTTVDEIWRDA